MIAYIKRKRLERSRKLLEVAAHNLRQELSEEIQRELDQQFKIFKQDLVDMVNACFAEDAPKYQTKQIINGWFLSSEVQRRLNVEHVQGLMDRVIEREVPRWLEIKAHQFTDSEAFLDSVVRRIQQKQLKG